MRSHYTYKTCVQTEDYTNIIELFLSVKDDLLLPDEKTAEKVVDLILEEGKMVCLYVDGSLESSMGYFHGDINGFISVSQNPHVVKFSLEWQEPGRDGDLVVHKWASGREKAAHTMMHNAFNDAQRPQSVSVYGQVAAEFENCPWGEIVNNYQIVA